MEITNLGIHGGRSKVNYTFRVDNGDDSYRVEAIGSPYIWTCKCSQFNWNLSGGTGRHCPHIIACKESIIASAGKEGGRPVLGIYCQCGANDSRVLYNGGMYACGTCGLSFTRQGRAPEAKPEPVPVRVPGMAHACTKCGSTAYTKAGKNPNGKQMYRCSDCNRRCVISEPGFERNHYSPEVVAGALNIVMAGASYRKTAEDVWKRYGRRVSPNTIHAGAAKYTRMMKPFLDALRPITGNVWSVDEAYINVRRSDYVFKKRPGKWLCSAIDPRTRFMLATRIASGTRGVPDVEAVLEAAKATGSKPDYVITDSLQAYERGIRRQFSTTAHVKTKSISQGFTNMAIERYHNEIREKLKSCRGLDTEESSQVFCDLLRIHHNFVRPHVGLDGKTPAEVAGVAGPEIKDGKYRALIRASSKRGRSVAGRLGDLAEHVHVRSRGNTTVSPKEWLDNGIFNEIDVILRGLGFRWIYNRITRGWVRFENAPPIPEAGVRRSRRAPV